MTIFLTRLISLVLVITGFAGIYIVKIPEYVEFDLWQTVVYLIFGFWGLAISLYKPNGNYIMRYLNATTFMLMLWLIIGIPFPNLFDIFHLEVLEHFFHAILFLIGVFAISRGKKLLN